LHGRTRSGIEPVHLTCARRFSAAQVDAGWWVAARCSTSRPVGNGHDFVGHSRVRQARDPDSSSFRSSASGDASGGEPHDHRGLPPATGGVPSAAPGNSARSRRLILQDARAETRRRRSRRDVVDDGQALVRERVDTLGAASRRRWHGLHAFLAVDAEADQGGRSCCPAPMPSGWLAAPGGIVVGRGQVILAGSTAGTKMAGSAGAGTSKIRRWPSRGTGLAPTGRRAIASIARAIMVRWPSSKPGTSLISSHLAEDAIEDSS
jgi:hypothetical protein